MNIYDDMRAALLSELTLNSEQGELLYLEPGEQSGSEYDPVIGDPTPHPVIGIKKSGKRKNEYIAGGYIEASDTLFMIAEFGTVPVLSGELEANGRTYQIIMVDPITEEVPPVGWYIGCRV